MNAASSPIRNPSTARRNSEILFALRCAARRAYGVRKESFFLLSRHLLLSSQARLGTVPGYYQPSRYAGLNLYAVNSVESRALQKPKGVVHVRYCSLKKRR
jgi:hypothetical protein